ALYEVRVQLKLGVRCVSWFRRPSCPPRRDRAPAGGTPPDTPSVPSDLLSRPPESRNPTLRNRGYSTEKPGDRLLHSRVERHIRSGGRSNRRRCPRRRAPGLCPQGRSTQATSLRSRSFRERL